MNKLTSENTQNRVAIDPVKCEGKKSMRFIKLK